MAQAAAGARVGLLARHQADLEAVVASLQGTGVVCLAMDPGLVKTDLTQYQMELPAAATYMPATLERLRAGDHVPAAFAARLARDIAAGWFDRLSGRAISATENLSAVAASIDDILAADARVLRVIGFAPPPRPADDGRVG